MPSAFSELDDAVYYCAEVLEEVRICRPVKVLTEEVAKVECLVSCGNHGAVFKVKINDMSYALKVYGFATSDGSSGWRTNRWTSDQYLAETTAYRALKDADVDGQFCPKFYGCFRLSPSLFECVKSILSQHRGYIGSESDLITLLYYNGKSRQRLVRAILIEYIEGTTVTNLPKVAGDSSTLIRIMQLFSEALKELHKRHITHGSIKPDNLMISRDLTKVYLIDFGRAWVYAQEDGDELLHVETHGAARDRRALERCTNVTELISEMVTARVEAIRESLSMKFRIRGWNHESFEPADDEKSGYLEAAKQVEEVMMDLLRNLFKLRKKCLFLCIRGTLGFTSRTVYGMRESVLGKDHSDTLRSQYVYAVCNESFQPSLMSDSFEARTRLLGPLHPATLQSLTSLFISRIDHERAIPEEDFKTASDMVSGLMTVYGAQHYMSQLGMRYAQLLVEKLPKPLTDEQEALDTFMAPLVKPHIPVVDFDVNFVWHADRFLPWSKSVWG